MADDNSAASRAVGPYLLQRTLGKGQTGLVRLGVHCVTRKTVAVKIINREKLSNSVLLKVEREIAIMKLIDHPHVLGLYDVYESNSYLYLVLEHVSGGELFDYLVKKGRLSEREARRFFRQIVSAVDFCHKHKVCHRDLKPENLLLDENRNIKVADFGMASLQVGEKLLETSCGSPHYACPEVIRGEHYDGRKADTWSCGVILYALLVGALPFDDDNLRVLLEKVKRGTFHIPPYIAPGAQQLLRGMVDVNPKKRLSLDDVMRHSWFRGSHDDLEPAPPIHGPIQTLPLAKADIDPDVFKSMTSLGCFRDKAALVNCLLSTEPNEEKVVYFLLLSRKERQPSIEDEARALIESNVRDPPRKRVDSRSASAAQLQRVRAQSVGSANLDQLPPRSPRLSTNTTPSYAISSQGYYTYNAATPPAAARSRKISHAQAEVSQSMGPPVTMTTTSVTSSSNTLDHSAVPPMVGMSTPWKRKLSQTMRHLVVSPRFHRKRYDGSTPESTSSLEASSPQMAKRSWFANFRTERDKEEVVVVYRDKGFSDLKLSLLQAFKAVNCLQEELGESSFKVKYESSKHKGKHVFKKSVKLTVTVSPTHATASGASHLDAAVVAVETGEHATPPLGDSIIFDGRTFTVTFSHVSEPGDSIKADKVFDLEEDLIPLGVKLNIPPLFGGETQFEHGPTRRFRRVCDKLQAAIVNPSSVNASSVNPLLLDTDTDSGINPSLSSDDTLTNTASPVLGDATPAVVTATSATVSTSSREELGSCSLLGGYSTDECESEDGLGNNHILDT